MAIEDILMFDETLFQNINAFNPDYMPENYNFRDNQMEAMAYAIRPTLKGGMPSNAVILGPCATGKTTAVKKVFELVERTSDKVACCYINCQLNTTRFGIFSQIHEKLFGHKPPETGVPFATIYQKVMKYLVDNKKALIVAFDDANFIFQNKKANKVFYDILRAYEEYPTVHTGIFVILSELEFRFALDKNVKTVFIPQDITFQPYSRSEVLSILKDRVKVGFFPNVISEDLIEQITDYTIDSGDLRVGIDILRVCGNIAESDASREITQEHLDKALSQHVSFNLIETIKSLTDNELTLLKLIIKEEKYLKKDDILTATIVSTKFRKQTKVSYATFNRTLEKLEFLRLIDTKLTGKGIRGNSRQIFLRFDPDDLKSTDVNLS
ncbi:MAG: ORC1-type DNA replication protein [Methanobacteriaceae archaeon]|nr:ORC1-type DNA replication protein [Methanobacteriaceae archaeon]